MAITAFDLGNLSVRRKEVLLLPQKSMSNMCFTHASLTIIYTFTHSFISFCSTGWSGCIPFIQEPRHKMESLFVTTMLTVRLRWILKIYVACARRTLTTFLTFQFGSTWEICNISWEKRIFLQLAPFFFSSSLLSDDKGRKGRRTGCFAFKCLERLFRR